MYLEIITPEKQLYTGEVNAVRVPGSAGLFEILENHAPIISTLEKGQIRLFEKLIQDPIYFDIDGGVIEAKENKITILAK
ncbi:MAG: ATP synthase F1 subunit epsilon [Bacteroidales bacterium]|jgi:F-type H+-transporting ATPase subunit epsilon|nr:ATP synthase F1 subunit epsilon [Bacteroidales bacterium]